MLSRLIALLILIAVAIFFLVSSEDDGAVALVDWVRDPSGSRRYDASWIDAQRTRESDAMELDVEQSGLTMIDDVPAEQGQDDPLPRDDAAVALALEGAESEDDLLALLASADVPLRGVVVGLDGAPLEGVTIGASQPGGHEARVETDERGAFELRLHGAAGSLAFDLTRWVGLGGELALAPGLNVGREERVLVLAPRADLGGRVLDAGGAPIAGARVVVEHELADVPEALRALVAARVEQSARSDADGAWTLAPLPDLPGLRVRFEAAGYTSVERSAEELREHGIVTL